MRFKISPKDAYSLPVIGFNGGEVVTLDEHEAIVAEMEAEIELACSACCLSCRNRRSLLNRTTDNKWVHYQPALAEDWWLCEASEIQEHRYQRQLKGLK